MTTFETLVTVLEHLSAATDQTAISELWRQFDQARDTDLSALTPAQEARLFIAVQSLKQRMKRETPAHAYIQPDERQAERHVREFLDRHPPLKGLVPAGVSNRDVSDAYAAAELMVTRIASGAGASFILYEDGSTETSGVLGRYSALPKGGCSLEIWHMLDDDSIMRSTSDALARLVFATLAAVPGFFRGYATGRLVREGRPDAVRLTRMVERETASAPPIDFSL